MNIILRPILSPQLELSLFYDKTAKDSTSIMFYMDDIFGIFKTYQEQCIFLHNHFFLHIVWSKLKLILSKLKIEMTKIFTLEEEHKIGGRIRLKPDKIEKILAWLVPQDQTAIKAFLDTIQSSNY